MTELNPLDRIQELCDERNWSYYQLAKVSGIAYSTLSTMINKHNMPSLPTLQKLCSGFGISITDFFDPGNSSKGLTSDQAQCLKLFTALSPEDKTLAITYMKGLSKTLYNHPDPAFTGCHVTGSSFLSLSKAVAQFSKFSPPFIVFFCHFLYNK